LLALKSIREHRTWHSGRPGDASNPDFRALFGLWANEGR
jgi:hypothetical protein